ncbi:MAG: hypothetical protein PHY80_03185 [Rickettsiales bacterium]|nr:hypothetical protein [Rickettsiales bacterium]
MFKIIVKERIYNKVKIKIFNIKIFSYYIDSKGKILIKNIIRNKLGSFLAIFIPNKIKRKQFR